MSVAQKIIKYLAIAFAIFLIVSIISVILGVIGGLAGAFNIKKCEQQVESTYSEIKLENNDISILDININSCNLIIKRGDYLKATTNNDDIICNKQNNKLEVKEKNHGWISFNNPSELIVYVPENMEFDVVNIQNGAGKVTLDNELYTKKLSLDLGAGETIIKNIVCTDNADIEGGAGNITIESGSINNLKFDIGVGKTDVTAELLGKNKIDSGIGSVTLNILGSKDDYKIKADKGIGSIKINESELSDNQTIGNGINEIDIDGGVGSIILNFK